MKKETVRLLHFLWIIGKISIATVLAIGIFDLYFIEPTADQKLPAIWGFVQLTFTLGALVIAFGSKVEKNNELKMPGAFFILSGILFILSTGLTSLGLHVLDSFLKVLYGWFSTGFGILSFILFSYALLELMLETIQHARKK